MTARRGAGRNVRRPYAPKTKAMLSPLTTVLLPVNGSYVITQPFIGLRMSSTSSPNTS